MMEPDFSHGYLRIPLGVWLAVFCRAPFTRRQLQLLAFVLRESWGWQTPDGQVHLWTRHLAVRHFARGTGLSTDHLKRDLDLLISRGVLRQSRRRFQFIADPQLWIALKPMPQDLRQLAPKSPEQRAVSALADLASKKRETKERNVAGPPDLEFSTGGDNSSSHVPSVALAGARSSAPAVARLVQIVVAFVGALSPSQIDNLRQWIDHAGVATVWAALEPALRSNPMNRRSLVTAIIHHRSGR